ncbi:GNAT family N-acetyltransferase [Yinghuangia sp. KLBMP8922]|uniref:GNAT family N-acetyltransferase n=1 Tax=Yinghuangia soli TaxID=2908204 RepID=A0AA41U2A3_9ACTN|nr:GNAT family N-acetyltransferase [Yinghuangia soli]
MSPLAAEELADAAPALAALLAATVDAGASVGFLAPLDPAAAEEWWRGRHIVLATTASMWVARDADERIVGTIQLHHGGQMPNGRHRGEIAKLMVHPGTRGGGLGRRLLETAETEARRRGLAVLILDTETGSPAEKMYASAGWTHCGVIPDFAQDASGMLQSTTLFAKRLDGTRLGSGGRPALG